MVVGLSSIYLLSLAGVQIVGTTTDASLICRVALIASIISLIGILFSAGGLVGAGGLRDLKWIATLEGLISVAALTGRLPLPQDLVLSCWAILAIAHMVKVPGLLVMRESS